MKKPQHEKTSKMRMFWFNLVAAVILISVTLVVLLYWKWIVSSCGESGSTILRNLALVYGGIIAIWVAIWRGDVADRQAETLKKQVEVAEKQVDVSKNQAEVSKGQAEAALKQAEAMQDQAKAALREAETSKNHTQTSQLSLLNERYQKGAEMIGNGVLSVRLGGIYALESLAKEKPEQYHVQIMRLFCDLVRHPTREGDNDVQAVLRAIATRRDADIKLEKQENFRLNLTKANLTKIDLTEAKLADSDLTGADLTNADLIGADLTGANLTKANLTGADLSNVKGLTQEQLNTAHADSSRKPTLDAPLKWRGEEPIK